MTQKLCWGVVLTLGLAGAVACGKYGPPRRSSQATAAPAASQPAPAAASEQPDVGTAEPPAATDDREAPKPVEQP